MIYEMVKIMTSEQRKAVKEKAESIMYKYFYSDDNTVSKDEKDEAYDIYCTINDIEDDEYRDENMAAFKEYAARMDEPDFDWDYYSDWHKDMFGYRPHYKVIPADEDARQEMFETFHRNRGF